LTATIGVDLLVMRQAALLAIYFGESDQDEQPNAVTRELSGTERADLDPPLFQRIEDLLGDIGGWPLVSGGSGASQPAPLSVQRYVDQMLDTAASDLDASLGAAGAAVVTAELARLAGNVWTDLAQGSPAIARLDRLRWVVGNAIKEALAKLQLLVLGMDWIPVVVTEISRFVARGVVQATLKRALGWSLVSAQLVEECDLRLKAAGANEASGALDASGAVAADHTHWRRWIPGTARGVKAVAAIPLLPWKKWCLLAVAFILTALTAWGAAAHLGSPRLPAQMRFGIRNVRGVVMRLQPAMVVSKADDRYARKLNDATLVLEDRMSPAAFDQNHGKGEWDRFLKVLRPRQKAS